MDRSRGDNGIAEEGEYAVLIVQDNGTGISKSDMERNFEPFCSKKVMGKSGTELGMAVVWGTVKDHSGFIDTHSREGVGTTLIRESQRLGPVGYLKKPYGLTPLPKRSRLSWGKRSTVQMICIGIKRYDFAISRLLRRWF